MEHAQERPGDVAAAVLAALGSGAGAGQCLNVAEEQAAPVRLFFEQVISAAGARLELVRVPDAALPADLRISGTPGQHLLASPRRAREVLGWRAAGGGRRAGAAPGGGLAPAPPPPDAGAGDGFGADDGALAAAL